MDNEVSDVFAMFGPGVIYSHDTLQNFVDFFMRIDFNNYQNEIPFITQTTKQQQNSDIDQLSDLDGSREFLLNKFSKFLSPIQPLQLKIEPLEPPLSNLSVMIADTFLFPSLELMTQNDSKCAEEAIHDLSQFFQNNLWNGDNDIPMISHRIVLLLSSVFEKADNQSLSKQSLKELVELWLSFFESRGVIDDLLIFTISWIKRKSNVDIDIKQKIQSVIMSLKESITYPFIHESIINNTPVQFYVGKLIDQKIDPSAMSNIVQRRAAGINGFLYVSDTRLGIIKIGSGTNGTVFTSLEQQNDDYLGKVPQSIAICNNILLARFKNEDIIHVIDYITLKCIGFICENGSFSKDFPNNNTNNNSNETNIPNGPFTALFNTVYFVENSTLYIYQMQNDYSLKHISSVKLREKSPVDFEEPLPQSMNSHITLVTNGHYIAIFYPTKTYDRQFVSVREFSINDGNLLVDKPVQTLLSNCVCFDPIACILYDLPDYEVPLIYHCDPNILTYYRFPFPDEKSQSGLPPLDILNCIPSLLSSRLSTKTFSFRKKYILMSTSHIYDNLSVALSINDNDPNKKSLQQLIIPIVRLLYLHLFQFNDADLCSKELIEKLLKIDIIPRTDKVLFVRALFLSEKPPMNKIEHVHKILHLIEPSILIEATQTYEKFNLVHLLAILSSNEIGDNYQNKFLKYAVENFGHSSYSFIQILVTSISRYVFKYERIKPTSILVIFKSLKPVSSHLFLSIIATMLPLLKQALSEPLAFASSLNVFESFLKEMHSMIPPNALKDYATNHISVSSEQPFVIKTVIDETPHPYQNNMDYVHHYDFPSAIEITVTFDSRTNSETNCDYLQIFTDRDCNKKLTDRLSGKISRWKEKIVTTAKHLSFKFHSDGSVTEWGYKATISAKLFSRMNFTSPHPAYDVFRAFFYILLKMMKTCDALDDYQPVILLISTIKFDKFKFQNIPDLYLFAKQLKNKIINIYIKKFNVNMNDDIQQNNDEYEGICEFILKFLNRLLNIDIDEKMILTSSQLSVISYLLTIFESTSSKLFNQSNNSESSDEFKNEKGKLLEFIKNIITAPFIFDTFDLSSLNDNFSNLANIMLFYIPQGIPDSELDFLYKSLKGTKAAEQFVEDSLSFAEKSFKSQNLSLSSICYAANKASLAFQLLQNPNFESFLDHWFDCLRALSKIRSTPNSTLTPTSVSSILDFGCMFGDLSFTDPNDFVKRHLDILNETSINEATFDIPLVSLIIKRLLLMNDPSKVDNDFSVSIVLRTLCFCLPYVIPLLNQFIDKFNVQINLSNFKKYSKLFIQILEGIGKSQKVTSCIVNDESVIFDYGVTFSNMKAECVRKMIADVNVLNDIMTTFAINSHNPQDYDIDNAKLAVLLILSCRSFDIRPCHRVLIEDLNLEATVSSIGPFGYMFKTDRGDDYHVPIFDFTQYFNPIGIKFRRIIPNFIPKFSKELTNGVLNELKLLTGPTKVFAFNAANELLSNTDICDYSKDELLSMIDLLNNSYDDEINIKIQDKFVKFDEMNEMLPPSLNAYIYKKPISVYKISMTPFQGKFGFCELGNSSPSSAILFECNEKTIIFQNTVLAENETIVSIIIGYLEEGMRVFLIVNKQLKLIDFYLPPSSNFVPLIIVSKSTNAKMVDNTNSSLDYSNSSNASNKVLLFEKSPVIDFPFFNCSLTLQSYSPTHIFLNENIISIDSICTPLNCKFGEPFCFDLFPPISSTLHYYFIEFMLSPEFTSVSLRSPFHKAYSFYNYEINSELSPNQNITPNDTFGLFINFDDHYCFVTLNESILSNSISKLPVSDWTITFYTKTLETLFINIGQLPFMFDIDNFIQNSHNKNTNDFIQSHIKDTEIHRTNFVMTSPIKIQNHFLNEGKMSLFSLPPKIHNSSVLRPFLINTSEKGSFYHGKIGYGKYNFDIQPINEKSQSLENNINSSSQSQLQDSRFDNSENNNKASSKTSNASIQVSNQKLLISNDTSFTISNISFPEKHLFSLIDNASKDTEEFQQIYQRFIMNVPIQLCYGLSPFNASIKTDFFTSDRKIDYFASICRSQKYNILNICMFKLIEKIGVSECISKYNLMNFIVNSITNIDNINDFEPEIYFNHNNMSTTKNYELEPKSLSYVPILEKIFDSYYTGNDTKFFEQLCNKALLPFRITSSDFSKYPLNIISFSAYSNNSLNSSGINVHNSNSKTPINKNNQNNMSRITLDRAQAIIFVPLDLKFIQKPHKFCDSTGEFFVISKDNSDESNKTYNKSIFVIQGDTIIFDSFDPNEIILSYIIPIQLGNPISPNMNFRFSIQFISCLLYYLHSKLSNIQNNDNYSINFLENVHQLVLAPLWELYMENNQRIFQNIQAQWFSLIFQPYITLKMKKDFAERTRFNILIHDQPNILTGVSILIAIYVRCALMDSKKTIENVSHALMYALSLPNSPIKINDLIENFKDSYGISVFRQFATEIFNPFSKHMPFPYSIESNAYFPILTNQAFQALTISKLPMKTSLITQNNKDELPSAVYYNFQGASQIALIKLLSNSKGSITIDKTEIKSDTIIEGEQVTIKISRSSSENKKFGLMVIPLYPIGIPSYNDIQEIHRYQKHLMNHWSPEYEAFARCLVQAYLPSRFYFIFSIYPDTIYQMMFPNVDPKAARFRLCLLYLTYGNLNINTPIKKNDTEEVSNINLFSFLNEFHIPTFNRHTIETLLNVGYNKNIVFDVLTPWKQMKEIDYPPISINFPLKNAKLSDFFFQLSQIIDSSPISFLPSLSNLLPSPGINDSIEIHAAFSQLENDMFCNGAPFNDECSNSKLKAYQAFGCLLASLANSGYSVPLYLRSDIIQYAFGDTSIQFEKTNAEGTKFINILLNNDQSENSNSNEKSNTNKTQNCNIKIEDSKINNMGVKESSGNNASCWILKALSAIRSGVMKFEIVCPSIKKFSDPIISKTLNFYPQKNSSQDEPKEPLFFQTDKFLTLVLKKLIIDQGDFPDNQKLTEYFKNNFAFSDEKVWIELFAQYIQREQQQES